MHIYEHTYTHTHQNIPPPSHESYESSLGFCPIHSRTLAASLGLLKLNAHIFSLGAEYFRVLLKITSYRLAVKESMLNAEVRNIWKMEINI